MITPEPQKTVDASRENKTNKRVFFLNKENENMEIMADYEKRQTVTLKELMPNWWGNERYEGEKPQAPL